MFGTKGAELCQMRAKTSRRFNDVNSQTNAGAQVLGPPRIVGLEDQHNTRRTDINKRNTVLKNYSAQAP